MAILLKNLALDAGGSKLVYDNNIIYFQAWQGNAYRSHLRCKDFLLQPIVHSAIKTAFLQLSDR